MAAGADEALRHGPHDQLAQVPVAYLSIVSPIALSRMYSFEFSRSKYLRQYCHFNVAANGLINQGNGEPD